MTPDHYHTVRERAISHGGDATAYVQVVMRDAEPSGARLIVIPRPAGGPATGIVTEIPTDLGRYLLEVGV